MATLEGRSSTLLPGSGRVPGLDALRALAVVVVVGYHLGVPVLGGGFLGVTLFFVLSGYLITRLLLDAIQRTGSVGLSNFWGRRLRRLVPAAYTVVLVCVSVAMFAAPERLDRIRGDALAALGYSSNWWTIFHRVSYFDTFDVPSPLAHLWTLAIEEQFYLIWPVVLTGLLVLVRRREAILAVLGVAVLASATQMAVTYDAADPNRSYLGTDTRMGELLVGSMLAIALHLVVVKPALTGIDAWAVRVLQPRPALTLLAGSAGVWAILVVTASGQSTFTYRGGILLAAIASAGMILALQAPSIATMSARLDDGALGALGRRSYSIYLWHFPILVAFSTAEDFGRFDVGRSALVVALTLLCAEASYRAIEGPVRRLGFTESARVVVRTVRRLPRARRALAATGVSCALALPALALTGFNAAAPPDHGPTTFLTGAAPAAAGPGPAPARAVPKPPQAELPVGPLVGRDTVAIGDSLMINIAPLLNERFPGITINAKVGRQPRNGLAVARSYSQFNAPGRTYVLGIGTNGPIDDKALDRFVVEHSSARILLITPRVNRPWEGVSVAAIRRAAAHDNVRVVDFHKASRGHGNYFGGDGVHLTPAGQRATVRLIREAASD
ncbi:MAG: acyltransferase family protein [Propionibacteriales bacterium]|nr:acyltransferase family protein [Propionibacteriales bacterium]